MGKKKTGLYAAIGWLARNPESTAYEVARGIGFADAWRVFEWLALAERDGLVMAGRRNTEIALRWRVIATGIVPGGPAGRLSSGSDTSGLG